MTLSVDRSGASMVKGGRDSSGLDVNAFNSNEPYQSGDRTTGGVVGSISLGRKS